MSLRTLAFPLSAVLLVACAADPAGDPSDRAAGAAADADPCPAYAGFGEVGATRRYALDGRGTWVSTTSRRTDDGDVEVTIQVDGSSSRTHGRDTYRCDADGLAIVAVHRRVVDDVSAAEIDLVFDDGALLLPSDPAEGASWRDPWAADRHEVFESYDGYAEDATTDERLEAVVEGEVTAAITVSDALGTWDGLRVALVDDPVWGGAELLLHETFGLVDDGTKTLVRAE